MNRLSYAGLTTALVVGALFLGARVGHQHSPSPGSSGRKILYYVDPMNPAHTSPLPGRAPCGMDLEPVYADDPADRGRLSLASLPPGSIRITPEKQQLLGMQMGQVQKEALSFTRRLLGRVAVDETRVYWINATVDGWITKTLPFATGDFVRSNQVLATFYSPEFLAAGNALLFALNSQDRAKGAGPTTAVEDSRMQQFNRNLQQYADSLKNLGMGDPQIHEMIETRRFRQNVDLIAPADGVILARNVSDGLRFEQGTELYRIADLKHVWILADIFETDAEILKPGLQVRVTSKRDQRTFTATVSSALPRFDAASRTLKARLELDNPDFALQPEMFVDLEFPVEVPETMFIAADALVDTGKQQTVFVHRGEGYFEPRTIKTGRRFGDNLEVLAGLEAGESIVVAGTFLVDSESRMKLAAAGRHGPTAKDPVCGMSVDEQKARTAGLVVEEDGKPVFFCNASCKEQFVAQKSHQPCCGEKPEHTEVQQQVDPVCGMKVTMEKAEAAGWFTLHEGKKFYFCNDGCQREFGANPARFLKPASAAMSDAAVEMPKPATHEAKHVH